MLACGSRAMRSCCLLSCRLLPWCHSWCCRSSDTLPLVCSLVALLFVSRFPSSLRPAGTTRMGAATRGDPVGGNLVMAALVGVADPEYVNHVVQRTDRP